MLTQKDKYVITELFNIGFSKSISRLSLLLDDRLDITVPDVTSFEGNKIDYIFKESNLIFNDVKGVVNIINGELEGTCIFLIEYNENIKEFIDEIDIETTNKMFIDTVLSTMNALVNSNIDLVNKNTVTSPEDLLDKLNNLKEINNKKHIIYSRWTTRNHNLAGNVFLLVDTEKFLKLPKFIELLGLS